MNLNEYQKFTCTTNIVDSATLQGQIHILTGLSSELGEVMSLFQKAYRGDHAIDTQNLEKEVGDVLWHLSELCNSYGISLQRCIRINVAKLKDRQSRNVIRGSGDNR